MGLASTTRWLSVHIEQVIRVAMRTGEFVTARPAPAFRASTGKAAQSILKQRASKSMISRALSFRRFKGASHDEAKP